jgi:AhpC/TSA family protein
MDVGSAELTLESVDGGAYRFDELRAAHEHVLLLFAHSECPTSRLALERLGPLGPAFAERGVRLVCVLQEPLETAARLARQHGIDALVLAERPPYDAARRFGVETVPTTILLDADGSVEGSVVGWAADKLNELLPLQVPDAEPRWKPGCEARPAHDAHLPPPGPDAFDELEDMFERGWTDGLPVVPPTADRVAAMLGEYDPDRSLGTVPPGLGEATLARVAACAVLAGCKPAFFPIVLAAVEAMLDPAFNVHGQAVTTSPPGQIVIVNGPVRGALGLNSGMGALGPGNRANLTIGRAVRLVVQLTGGGVPGGLDRATLGHQGKISFCFAENEEASPWESLSVERGFPAEASTVTLIGGDAPLSISDHRSKTPRELAATIGWAAAVTWSPFWWPLDATSLFILGQEHVRMFAQAGWSKADVRETIFEEVRRPARELRHGETTPQVLTADPDTLIPKWDDPERIVIVVAGGEAGRFSAVCGPSLGMGASVITREVPWST